MDATQVLLKVLDVANPLAGMAAEFIAGKLGLGTSTVEAVKDAVTGKMTMVQAQAGTSTAFVWFYDGTYPGANGAIFNGSITYQT